MNPIMIMLIFVGAVGLCFMIAKMINSRKEQSRSAYPKMPWMRKSDWAAGRIIASDKAMIMFSVCGAMGWILYIVPDCFWFLEKWYKNNLAAWIGLLLPVTGMGIIFIVLAIVSILRWRKFGSSVFRMSSVPGVIGGQLAGVIQTSTRIRPTDGFHLTLSCVRYFWGWRKDKLWQKTQTVAHELLDDMAGISIIPVKFQIPDDCQSTDEINDNDKTIWRLTVTAKVPGPFNYSATFEVPVFKMPESENLA